MIRRVREAARRRVPWVALYLVTVTALIYAAFWQRRYDDPFITYRYAQNLAAGAGFVYNAGERVLSTTTPGFTLLLAALSWAWPDLPALAALIGAVSLAAAGLLGYWLARGPQGQASPWAGAPLLALLPFFPLVLNTLGSETPLYIALCLGVFTAYTRRRYTLAALCAALATLMRPDGILVAMLLAARVAFSWWRLLRQGKKTALRADFCQWLPGVVLFVLLLLAWAVFAWGSFGSPLPATLAAKQSQGSMSNSQSFAEGFLLYVRQHSRGWQYWLEAGLAAIGLAAVGRRRLALADGLLLTWTLLYFVAYTALGVTRYFWYYAPLIPGFLLLAGWGLATLGGLPILGRARRFAAWPRWATAGLLAVLLAGHVQAAWQFSRYNDGTYWAYRAVGEWLAMNTPAETTVGALEVGVIGYYAQRRMVDFAGLLQPEVAVQLRGDANYEDTVVWAIEYYHPDYVLLFPGTFPRADARVAQTCRPVQRFIGAEYGYWRDVVIHDCRSAVDPLR